MEFNRETNTRPQHSSDKPVGQLVSEILQEAQQLVRQEMALARAEIVEEVSKIKNAGLSFGVAAVVAVFGAFFFSFTLAFALEAFFGIPLWGSFALVTLLYMGAGLYFFFQGREQAKKINLVPEQTIQTMKENVRWITSKTP